MALKPAGRRELMSGAGLFLAYVVTARLGLMLGPVAGFATLVWPPTGIALFGLVTFGRRLWPAVFVAALLVNFTSGAPPLSAFGIAAGNTLEAVLGAGLLLAADFHRSLDRVRDAVSLIFFGAILSPLVSATVGVVSLWLGSVPQAAGLGATWRAWWVGDMLGGLIVAPLLLVWASPRRFALTSARRVEMAAMLIAGAVSYALVFGGVKVGGGDGPLAQAYVLYPVLIWAALRFEQRGAVTSLFLICSLAVAATAAGRGPFGSHTLSESLLWLQSFMGISAGTMLVLASAVCERNRAVEENVRLLHEAQKAVRVRDDFLSVASHELKTPLTSLALHVSTLQRTADREDVKVRGKLVAVERQVRRLGDLVENLLDVSRVAEGGLALEPEKVDLKKVVDEVVERFHEEAARAGTKVVVTGCDACEGLWDASRLDQVVSNLMSNALKYGRGHPVEVVLAGQQSSCSLRVRDHGFGIAPADQARIFERFERAASDRNITGLGLGLWISKQIVTRMGGTISVESEPGRGAEFVVTLPRAPPP